MTLFSIEHILMLIILIIITLGLCFLISKLNRMWQNIIFIIITIIGSGGVFFRFGLGFGNNKEINWFLLSYEMLQVCHFNFILLPLMLIPKFELARQYSSMFSMFAAATVFTSFPKRFASLPWYDITVINFFINHYCAVLLPILMIVSRRHKPDLKYLLPVSICVFLYFLGSFLGQIQLIEDGVLQVSNSLSFIFRTDGVPIFDLLYKLIPIPFVYLLPSFPFLIGLMYGVAWLFRNYKVKTY